MAIDYPEELPMPQFGSDFNPRDPQMRTRLQSGRDVVRLNFTAVPVDFTATFVMKSDAQAVQFEDFYWDALGGGVDWFNMPLLLPQGRGPYLVQFVGSYSRRRLNSPGADSGWWSYSCRMQIFLRPQMVTTDD